MDVSAEVRWFAEGPLPPGAAAWFDALGPPVEAEARTDRYLAPASPDEPGVKLRQGRLEVKQRARALGPLNPAPGVEGRAEAWRKWAFPVASDADAAAWVAVEKTRRQRTYAVAGGRAEAVPAGRRLETGANLELSALRAGGRTWWSVCVEAFGPDAAAAGDALRVVAAHVFAHGAPPTLPAERSMGYPAWLHRVAGA